jgi:orotate phosphoribosyltransferase
VDQLQRRLIEVLIESGALLTGREFKLKSGEVSDTFLDFGSIPDGRYLDLLGQCYADKIIDTYGLDGFDVVFGPAYKAIPIATATVIAIYRKYEASKRYAFNRKVPKSYGEGRQLLGGVLQGTDRVVIVDDVFTDGGAKLESLQLLRETEDPEVVGIVVGVNRSKPGALEKFDRESGGVPVHAICAMDDVKRAFSAPR